MPVYREAVIIGKVSVVDVNTPCSRILISLNKASLSSSMFQSDLFCSLAKLRLTSAGNFPRVIGINKALYKSGVISKEDSPRM